jgi:GTP cyclohydrolase I
MKDRRELLAIQSRAYGGWQRLVDVQASRDERGIGIDRVGVKDLRMPIRVLSRDDIEQQCVATVDMYVSLPPEVRGTHMSRFVELLQEREEAFTAERSLAICHAARSRLNAAEAHLELEFEYFVQKEAPMTGAVGPLNYQVAISAHGGIRDDLLLSVRAPVTSLCPCSKEISRYGAHNQRCEIQATVRFEGDLWIEDLIETIESCASSPIYSVLKRPDEKHVTEKAYENPKFVEDIVRDLALALQADDRVVWFAVSSDNYESIHNHNAYAEIVRDKRG